MGKKKFINKKNSATYQLLARDTSDPNYAEGPNGERVFIRVDNNNQFSIDGFSDDDDDANDEEASMTHPGFSSKDQDSIFADADDEEEDDDDDGESRAIRIRPSPVRKASTLPDNVRKEILELGFPDDGYNYLAHLREIKNAGGGSTYYENSKAKVEVLPLDVKAYDASRVRVPGVVVSGSNEESVYGIAASTVAVRVQKAVDPEVLALLDDSDMSRFGSDVEDLEDDFVVEANVHEEGAEEEEEEEEEDVIVDKKINSVERPEVMKQEHIVSDDFGHREGDLVSEKPRTRRLLDEQFDMLTLQEYGTDSDSDYHGSVAAEDVPLADKLNDALKDREIDDFDIDERYKAPADFLRGNGESKDGELVDSAAHVIRRCAEYGEMYADESQNNEDVVIFEESSDESEVWDCETIVTTYSNLDNHPGKIVAPMKARKKRLSETIAAVSSVVPAGNHVISLRGKEKIPVDFLPGRKSVVDKVSKVPGSRTDLQKGRPQEESKEEKKERKAAVKEERREARKAKKELKEIYRGETQRAQKVVAISGPSSIHLM